MAPVGAEHLAPPIGPLHATGVGEVVGKQAGKDEGPLETFGVGAPAGRGHEGGEALVADGMAVDFEAGERDFVDRTSPSPG